MLNFGEVLSSHLERLRRRNGPRLTVAITLALFWHFLIAYYILQFGLPNVKTRSAPIASRQISKGQFSANRQVQKLTPEQAKRRDELKQQLTEKRTEEEKKKIEKELKELKGQIVDLPASPDQKPPENAKYLSEFNTNTKKETKSRHREQDYKRATNEVTGALQQAKPTAGDAKALAVQQKAQEKKAAKAKQQAALEIPRQQQQDRLALSIDDSLGLMKNHGSRDKTEGNSDRLNIKPGEVGQDAHDGRDGGDQPQSSPSVKDLMPSVGVMAKIAGAPANDFLSEDVPDGEGTFLNSREFKFAPFFNRLKQSVSQHWKPMNEMRRRDPSGNIYGVQARVTVVSVVLNAAGEVTNVEVQKSSGLDFLDKEAIEAFQRAQPFPNVPKQLMKDGRTEFTFGFHIEFSNRGFGFDF